MKYLKLENGTYVDISDKKYSITKVACNQRYSDIKQQIRKARNTNIILDITIDNKHSKEDLIRNLIKIYKDLKRYNIRLGMQDDNKMIIAKINDYTQNEEEYKELIIAINAMQYENKVQMYNYLYDSICDFLDNEFVTKNICGFKNDKCKIKANTDVTMGCCHHNGNKYFGILYGSKLCTCEYLIDRRCTAQCITCKLFTCDELEKEGIKYTVNNIPLLKYFFNPIQKFVVISSHFTPKDKILKRIIRWSF